MVFFFPFSSDNVTSMPQSCSRQRLLQTSRNSCWGPLLPRFYCKCSCSYTHIVLFSWECIVKFLHCGAADWSCWVLWPRHSVYEFHSWCFVWIVNFLKSFFCLLHNRGLRVHSGLGGKGWRTLVCARRNIICQILYYWSILH